MPVIYRARSFSELGHMALQLNSLKNREDRREVKFRELPSNDSRYYLAVFYVGRCPSAKTIRELEYDIRTI